MERDFTAQAPDRLWVADFTYLRTWEGVVFFAFVIDVFSRMIVGWQFATHMRTDARAGRAADGARPPPPGADVALVHHSDRGSHSTPQTTTCRRSRTTTWPVRSAPPAIVMTTRSPNSFVDSFKTELIADRVWRTHEQAELAIVEWVGWFNHQRLHSSLGDIPPAEHKANWRASQDR